MANNNNCGGRNNNLGCLGSVGGRWRWEGAPACGGCPDGDGRYDGEGGRPRRGRGAAYGLFAATLPLAVAANGIIPLCSPLGGSDDFRVNSGVISVGRAGTYLATFTVRLPAEATVDTTITLNVDDASQASAVTVVGGQGPASFTGQAIFSALERSTVTLRTAEAINIAQTSAQPLFTLTLIKID